MSDPITIYSLSDSVVDNAGGRLFRIFGDFSDQFGFIYNVHIGATGTIADTKAYSGKPGQKTDILYWNNTELRCYLPRLDSGTLLNVLIRRTDGGREQLIPNCLQVLPRQYYGSVYDLRAVLPPFYLLGPRNLDNEEPTV